MSRRDEQGLMQVPVAGASLLALLVLITVSALLLGQAAETWDSQVRHELEQDLIFRGEEYQRAITAYIKKRGTPPTKLEDLCPKESGNEKFIRRCWTDPITGEEFRHIGPTEVGQRRALREASEAAELDGSATPTPATGGRDRQGNGHDRRDDNPNNLPGSASDRENESPFVGVASDSDRKGFIDRDGTSIYSEWEFVAKLPNAAGGLPGGPAGGVGGGGPGGVGGTGGGGVGGGAGGGGGIGPGGVGIPGQLPPVGGAPSGFPGGSTPPTRFPSAPTPRPSGR